MSRFAILSFVAAAGGLLCAVQAYTHASLDTVFTAAAIGAAALPFGLVAIARKAVAGRRALRLAIPGMVLGALVAAPAVWLLTVKWG